MGDALVSALVRDMLQKLASLAIEEVGVLRRFKDDVLNLTNDFKQIQAVLEDAEGKANKEKTVELWLNSLRLASLQVENVLDEVSTEALLQRLHIQRGIKYRVRAFFSSTHNQLLVRTRIAHKLKNIRIKLDGILAKRFELKLIPGAINNEDGGVSGGMPNRETSSLLHSSTIFGRDEETEMVVEKICNKHIGKHEGVANIRVYAIWGMGGLGKTTLAQLVYNHERVDKHFELKCWRYVSEKFQVKELIKGIIESMDKSEFRLSHLDDLQRSLQVKLMGKRFFIVLDDVWIADEEKSEWDKLSDALSCGAEGSIVLVTTRNETTSRMVAKLHELQHKLGCLSEKHSWLLFEKIAFAEGRPGGDKRELEPIGKEIVEKCKGLPLAVKTLGGLMWSKSSMSDWEHVLRSNIWELQDNNILPALKLSYDNLLPHIKRCFSYCCLLPKGYEMDKDLLILLWMANGFIPPRGERSSYLLGEEIYNCLVWRSFIQVVDGSYQMHDLMHDLAEYVMIHDCLIIQPGKKPIAREEVLHLSSSYSDFVYSEVDLRNLRSLRSVFIFMEYDYEDSIMLRTTLDKSKIIGHIFELVYLRVLYIIDIESRTLPGAICKLKYLKYLNLYRSKIEELPKSIIYLQNLQVLILEMCIYLRTLPEGIRYMKNLQHLNIKECDSLEYLPVGILKGVNDVRLSYFPVCKKKGAKIKEIGDLNLIEGELQIKGLENVEGGLSEAKNANLKSKKNLSTLILQWGGDDMERIGHDEEDVLEGLEPDPNLKELGIYNYMGKNISPSWIVNLNNLVKIKFSDCTKCEHIPSLGKFPSLTDITLWSMHSLKCFNEGDNTSKSGETATTLFPALQMLKIEHCSKLVSLPSYFPKLSTLVINSCESLLSLPDEIQNFKDLNQLVIYDCENLSRRYEKEIGVDWPKISHISYISITPISVWTDR